MQQTLKRETLITLGQAPGRVDLLFTDTPNANLFDPSRSDFKPFFWVGNPEKLSEASGFGTRLLAQSSGVSQVAFAAALIMPASGELEASEILAKMLPHLGIDARIDRDIFYQVRHDQSKLGGLSSFIKWQTLSVQTPTMGLPIGMSTVLPLSSRYAVRVELDIFGGSEDGPGLSGEEASNYMRNAQTVVGEIASRGTLL